MDKSEVADIKLKGMSAEKRAALTQRMNQLGLSVGIGFKSGGKIGSTRCAHVLIHLSQTRSPEIQDTVVEKLFEAYHELEKDISSLEILGEIAISAGLDGSEVEDLLRSNAGETQVDEEARKNREIATSGVPLFIIQGEHQINGAQDPSEFMEAFIKAKESG
jgi:predicted DsbA family dithiol-disulfide isomerase